MSKIAIIAAMEREVAPLVRGWKKSALASGDRKFTLFEREGVRAVVSGIGCANAELAARAVVEQFHPSALMSVGLAGALIRSLKVGSIFTPSVVVDAADEAEYRCSAEGGRVSGGVLVSSGRNCGSRGEAGTGESFSCPGSRYGSCRSGQGGATGAHWFSLRESHLR